MNTIECKLLKNNNAIPLQLVPTISQFVYASNVFTKPSLTFGVYKYSILLQKCGMSCVSWEFLETNNHKPFIIFLLFLRFVTITTAIITASTTIRHVAAIPTINHGIAAFSLVFSCLIASFMKIDQ